MSEEIIELDEYRPHLAGRVKCLACNHQWEGVSPVGTTSELLCPRCECHRGVYIYAIVPSRKRHEVFVCSCGNDIFFVHRDQAVTCLKCGLVGRPVDGSP